MANHPGHLFVVHGKIEQLIHDAAILSVGQEFHFSRAWTACVGPNPTQPTDWENRGWGRVFGGPDRVWAVSVGGYPRDDYDLILNRVESALRRIDERRDKHQLKRNAGALPLVAIPVIGIGLGGYSGDRGTALRALVERLSKLASELALDVALVTPDPAVYAAAQYARRKVPSPLPAALDQAARDLGSQAMRGEIALFLGAGVGMAAGLPSLGNVSSNISRTPSVCVTSVDRPHR